MTPAEAAVGLYNERCALFFELWAVSVPDPDEHARVDMAYRILSRARDAEVFGDPRVHHDLPVDTIACSW